MRILVLGARDLPPSDHEVDHIVSRCVIGISGELTDIIEELCIRHIQSLRGVGRIGRRRVGVSLPADRSQRRRKRIHTLDRRGLVDECGMLGRGRVTCRRLVDIRRVDAGGVAIPGEQFGLELFGVSTRVVVRVGTGRSESRNARWHALYTPSCAATSVTGPSDRITVV
jgi:hypothetical protein